MNYKSEIDMISKFMDLANSNAQNYRASDTSRCYYTDGMMQGLTYSLKASGHQVEYLTYIADNGCPRPASLSVDGIELIKDSSIQYDALKQYIQDRMPKARITIYQISSMRDNKNLSFINYENLPQLQGTSKINSSIYDRVYTGEMACSSLEDLYNTFNMSHPKDYHARSLSVSDVVQIEGASDIQDGFYFCNSVGFKSISFEPEKTQDGIPYRRGTEPQMENLSEPTSKVLMICPEKTPEITEMSLDLHSLQKAVDGYIEAVYPFDDNVAVIVNEEGKLNGLPYNRALHDDEGHVCDVTAGNMLIVGIGEEDFSGLTEEQIQKYDKLFHDPEQFRYVGGRLVVTKLRKEQNTHADQSSIKKAPINHDLER